MFRGGCPRLLSQLVGEIGAAIQNRDVNRLASVYDWSGVPDAAASRLLDRLEAMVDRPLVDIAPVYASNVTPSLPAPPPPDSATQPTYAAAGSDALATGPAAWMPSWSGGQEIAAEAGATAAGAAVDAASAAPPAPPPPRARPVGLRVEQTLAGTGTPARTVFGLRRSYGCFWVTL